jgi:uncharacterized repeat protein (TIGR01451 family)
VEWWWVAQFTVPNNFTTPPPSGFVYYNAHDYLAVGSEYYGFGESNSGQTMIMHSLPDPDGNHGTYAWETVGAIGGRGDAFPTLPLRYDNSSTPWTPTGSFIDLGYGKTYTSGADNGIFLAVNSATTESLRTSDPAAFAAAFTDLANWTWRDDTQGFAAAPLILESDAGINHDFREHWYAPNPDPNAPWTIIYSADYGGGPRALGYLGVTPPPGPTPPDPGPDPAPGPAPSVTVFDPAISKRGTLQPGDLGLPGEPITWTIMVTQQGSASVDDVVITDTLDPALRIDSVSTDRGTVAIDWQTVTVRLGQLAPGDTVTIQIVTTVLAGAPSPVSNTATVTGSGVASATATVSTVGSLPSTGYGPN